MSITKPSFYCDGITNILSCSVSESHGSTMALATIDAISTTLTIGNYIEIYAQPDTSVSSTKIFSGYVKQIERKTPSTTISITANDKLVRAVDYFIAPTNPDNSYKRSKIAAETVVSDLLAMAGLTAYSLGTTYFVLANTGELEIKLVSVYDYCKTIADVITWNIWCDRNGNIYFRNRKPYVMTGDSGQPGDTADTIYASNITGNNLLTASYTKDEKDLRNRIVVYGANGYAEAKEESPYLPAGFYKTAVVGAQQMIDSTYYCQLTADYNLLLYNRLSERASLTIVGDPAQYARRAINIYGVTALGNVLNGNWYIYSCEHNLSTEGYITSLELRR